MQHLPHTERAARLENDQPLLKQAFRRYQPLSVDALAARLMQFGLTPADVTRSPLELQQAQLTQIKTHLMTEPQANAALVEQYLHALAQLGQRHDFYAFTEALNDLAVIWIDLYAEGVSITSVETLLSALCVPQWFSTSKTRALKHCLSHLLIESAARYDHTALEFARRHHQHSHLPNGRLLVEQLQQLLIFSQTEAGLLLISFKLSSTMLDGHRHRMPEVAVEIIKRLQQNLPKDHTLFHLDSYEFAVLSPQLDHTVKLDLLSAKLRRPFEFTVNAKQQLFSVSPVIGGVCRDATHKKADDMLAQARLALEHADSTYQPFATYSEALSEHADANAQLRQDVLDAFENDRMALYLQPIVDTLSGQCMGAEALLRCRKANGEFIPPPVVIEVLYQQGLGNMFIRWLINTSCRLASTIKQKTRQPIFLSINLTADDLINRELPYLLAQALKLWGVEASIFTLEITENGLLVDEQTAVEIMREFTSMGCRMALDDFGTGYSSMSRLRNLPIDLVKIDQSFVRNVAHSAQDRAIVQGIITMAHGLGKKVVAEGVEDADCRAIIQSLQCEKIQGYYFSRPLPFEQFLAWVEVGQTPAPQVELMD
ncbi:MAG: EAL domain-containing protein [Methylophilus sp.]|uniref:EAL domain-containing protein n=1 Tax=Methylophilus sp. TaxID=29541 RepID=UPI003F9FCAC4